MLEVLEDRIAPATTWDVNLTTDNGGAGGQQNGQNAGDLRYCATHAQSGDTVQFDPTVFTGATTISLNKANGEIPISGQSLTIQNTTGQQITINANNNSRIFDITDSNNVGLTEAISNLIFSGGNAPNTGEPHGGLGGAIYAVGSLTLTSDQFLNNNAAISGGAIYNVAPKGGFGEVTVNGPNSLFTENHANLTGGALDVETNNGGSNSVTLQNTSFTSNSTGSGSSNGSFGGAAYVSGPNNQIVQITACTFNNNSAYGTNSYGGAIDSFESVQVTYPGSGSPTTFKNNSATNGGAIYEVASASDPTAAEMDLEYVTFASNTAANGGAVYANFSSSQGQDTIKIIGSLFNGNNPVGAPPPQYGGGLYVNSATSGSGSSAVTLTNDTFYQNSADSGGGIALAINNTGTGNNTAVLTSLTVYQNTAYYQGGGLWISLTGGGTSTASVTLHNSIFAGDNLENPPSDGQDVFFTNNGGNNQLLQFLADAAHGGGYNLVGVTAAGDGTSWDSSDKVGSPSSPWNPYLASGLASNGGPTQTLAAVQPPSGAQGAWRNGDPSLLTASSPNNLDERNFKRTTYVTIGAEDPDAQPQ
jgi:hypothetical protein